MSGRSIMPDLPLFEDEASAAVAFFEQLRLPDQIGKPLLKDTCGPWFIEIVRALFGSLDKETMFRHVSELFVMVGKGNSKTTYCAALMLTALLMNERPNATYFFVAPSNSTAQLAYQTAEDMIKADPELTKRFWPRENLLRIEDRVTGAQIEVKTFSLEIMNGPKPVGVLLDEIHLCARHGDAERIMRQIRGGLQKNKEAFLVIITTQSNEPPVGIFEAELREARAIRDGMIDDPIMLPILYEFPEDIQKKPEIWQNKDIWSVVMPNLGRSIHLEKLVKDFNAEKRKSKQAFELWASQHLNIEMGIGTRSDGWAGAEYWIASADAELSRAAMIAANPSAEMEEIPWMQLQGLIDRCEVIVLGIDGGGLDDLLGVSVLGRVTGTTNWLLWNHAVVAPIALDRQKQNEPWYSGFEKDGDLTIAPLPQDMDVLDAILDVLEDSGKLATVSVDPSCVDDIKSTCERHGINEENGRFIGERQGTGLMKAITTAERRLAAGTLKHCGQPIMTWCVGNAKVRLTSSAKLIEREASGKGKIDPLVATFDAIMGMTADPQPPAPAVVEIAVI